MSKPDNNVGNPELLTSESNLIQVVKKVAYPASERWRILHGLAGQRGDPHLIAHYYVENEGLKGWFPTEEEPDLPLDIELFYSPFVGQIFLWGDSIRDKLRALQDFCLISRIRPEDMLKRLQNLHNTYRINSQRVKVVAPIVLPNQFAEDQYPPSIVMVARNHDPFSLREVYGLDQFGSPFGFSCSYNNKNDTNGDVLSGVSIDQIPVGS